MIPRATILIATRNRAHLLRESLSDLKDRRYDDVEIIVVDDGSTDDTGSVVAKYGEMVRYHRIERDGGYRWNPGPVWNVGHSLATSDIVIEQGAEIVYLSDCVGPLVDACIPGRVALARVFAGSLRQLQLIRGFRSEVKSIVAADLEPDPKTIRTEAGTWRPPKGGPMQSEVYCGIERQAPFLFCGAIHKTDFDAIEGYDEVRRDHNDTDLADRLIAHGCRFRFVGDAVAFHLEHKKD